MSTEDLVIRGATALSLGDYDQAVSLFTQYLVSNQAYDVLVQKARALTELNNVESALTDLTNALSLDANRPEAYLAKGIALFRKGEVKEAQATLLTAQEKSTENQQLIAKRWLKKCESELSNKDFKGSSVATTEAKTQQTKPAASIVEEVKTSDILPSKPASTDVLSGSGKIAYTWYQTSKSVGIEINHALANKNDLKTTFEAQKVEISFPIGNGSDYDLSLDLFDTINTENVKVTVHLSKIEIVMEKKNADKSWKSLNAPAKLEELPVIEDGPKKVDATVVPQSTGPKKVVVEPTQPPSYPTSSLKKKNWDKIDMEIEEDIKNNKADYCITDDPMKGIFKQIYDASDENTKRAMMKSYLTSGGTVLSTNWDEVKSKDYEGKDRPEAPKGQEWKKWEK